MDVLLKAGMDYTAKSLNNAHLVTWLCKAINGNGMSALRVLEEDADLVLWLN